MTGKPYFEQILNLPEFIAELSMAGLPSYLPLQAMRQSRTQQGEFTLPLVHTVEDNAFFTEVAFNQRQQRCEYLGMRMRCISDYRHGIYNGIDTLSLHHLIIRSFFPHRRLDSTDKVDPTRQSLYQDIVKEQLDRLSVAKPEMYMKMMAGFQLDSIPVAAPLRPTLQRFMDQQAQSCWFDAAHQLRYGQAMELLHTPQLRRGVLLDAQVARQRSAAWFQVDHDAPTLTGPLQLRRLEPEALDLVAELQRIHYHGGALPEQPSVATWLAQGQRVQIWPYPDAPERPVILVADPLAGQIGFYSDQHQRLNARYFQQAGFLQLPAAHHPVKVPQLDLSTHQRLFTKVPGPPSGDFRDRPNIRRNRQ